jgi:hypothetical protein
MRGKAASIAILSVFGFLAWADIASAIPPIVPNPNRDQLEGYCNENGGIFFPPSANGVYACLLPDGTLIACGGSIPICLQTRQFAENDIFNFRSFVTAVDGLSTKTKELENKIKALEGRAAEIEKRINR